MGTTFLDRTIMKPFVSISPKWLSPNIITAFRLICVPIIIYFLLIDSYKIGAVIFVIAAFSDALDGAVARTRDQITDIGKLFDPLADKLLVISTGAVIMIKFLPPIIFGIILFVELVTVVASIYYKYHRSFVIQANIFGKIKTLLQCIGLIAVFIYGDFYTSVTLLWLATWIFWISIVFSLMNLVYGRIKGQGSL